MKNRIHVPEAGAGDLVALGVGGVLGELVPDELLEVEGDLLLVILLGEALHHGALHVAPAVLWNGENGSGKGMLKRISAEDVGGTGQRQRGCNLSGHLAALSFVGLSFSSQALSFISCFGLWVLPNGAPNQGH